MRIRLLLILVMALWGSAFASSKLAVREVPHEVAGFLRFLIGTIALVVVLRLPRLRPRDAARVGGLGLVGVFGYNVCFFLGLSLAPAADGSVIVPMCAPVVTLVVTALLGRTAITPTRAAGLTAAVVGGVVFFIGIPDSGGNRLLGDLIFLGAAVCWAAYTILGAPILSRLSAPTVTVYATAAGSSALGLFATPEFARVDWTGLGLEFWLNQAYLGILPTALAYVLYYRAVGQVGPAVAASAMFLVPAFGLACAWVLLGESIAPVQAAGAALMFVGAWLNSRSVKPKTIVPPEVTEEPSSRAVRA
ncbi:DMT family transporter [Nocardia arthritidis]|uniref:DMT family transporter n=1 Tax=Nocardia arthritidis TaxID=228602 RepID=UPI00142E6552|nr:DMT family transporter [Nocardia arthritidis]